MQRELKSRKMVSVGALRDKGSWEVPTFENLSNDQMTPTENIEQKTEGFGNLRLTNELVDPNGVRMAG